MLELRKKPCVLEPVDPKIKPVVQPWRRIPVNLQEKVDKRIGEMLERGVIEEVQEYYEWLSPIVVVPKKKQVTLGYVWIYEQSTRQSRRKNILYQLLTRYQLNCMAAKYSPH